MLSFLLTVVVVNTSQEQITGIVRNHQIPSTQPAQTTGLLITSHAHLLNAIHCTTQMLFLQDLGEIARRGKQLRRSHSVLEINLLPPGSQGFDQTWLFRWMLAVKLVNPGEAKNTGKEISFLLSGQKIKYITEVKYLGKTRTLFYKISPWLC